MKRRTILAAGAAMLFAGFATGAAAQSNAPLEKNYMEVAGSQMAYVAASVLAGGNVRVGLEDNLMLDRGVLATNAQLVTRAREIIERLGARIIGPQDVRDKLGLTKRMPV